MGFFRKLFSARRAVERAMEEQEVRLTALASLPPERLAAEPDDVLCSVFSFLNDRTVTAQFGAPHRRRQTLADCYARLPAIRRTYALADLFSLGMETDGLCGILTGEERCYAWELPDILRAIGAVPHAELLESFFADNGIDPHEMSSFRIGQDPETDYAAQEMRYPYRAFNRAYSQLPPLMPCLAAYGRAHLAAFLA